MQPILLSSTDRTLWPLKRLPPSKPTGTRNFILTCPTAEVIWAARSETARTVEDVLARRTRALLLDARASAEIAEPVAQLMARELNYGHEWVNQQVEDYTELAKGYFLTH